MLRSDPKVLHITEATAFTGGVKQILLLIKELNKRNSFKQAVVCPPSEALPTVFKEAGFAPNLIPMFQDYDLLAAYRIARYIKKEGFGIVHAHHPRAHALALVARHFESFRLVVSRRVTHRIPWYPTSRWKYCSPKIERYICVSEAVKKELEAAGVEQDKLTVIGSSTDFSRFYPRPPNPKILQTLFPLPASRPSFLVGVIANYSAWKGQDLCLETFRILKGGGIGEGGIGLLLAGRDTDGLELKDKIKKMEIGSQILTLGWRDDADELLSALDALICPSLTGEGSSGAIREAFAMKIPVIASDIEANRELVSEKRGWLFKAGDASSLKSVLTEFTRTDLPRRQENIENAFRFVRENFSVGNMVNKTLAVYGVRP